MPLAVQANDAEKIRRILSDLLLRSESDECFLCDSGGYLVAHEGTDRADVSQISALGAGIFLASRELARMLGEREFNAVFHQGEEKNIFLRAVGADLLLAIIFSSSGSLGLVKLYSAPAVNELLVLFEEIRQRNSTTPAADHRSFVLREQAAFTRRAT